MKASDLYLGMPLKVEYKIDRELFRIVEQTEKILLNDKTTILHNQFRLVKWEFLPVDEIPSNLFDPEVIIGVR